MFTQQNRAAILSIIPHRPFHLTLGALVITLTLVFPLGRLRAMVPQIPREVDGWSAGVEAETYDRKTLFDYIDGGAELYLAYRFEKVYVYTFKKAGEPDIVADIYDMTTPEDAFGVFTAEREGGDIGIGDGSEYAPGLLRLFKGRFFVSIVAYEETPQSRKAVLSLAKAVSDAIPSGGGKPEIVSFLPAKGLIPSSVRYFFSHTLLNHLYYVADENILHLGQDTEAVLATYSVEGGRPYLLIVRYPTMQDAQEARASFLKAYMPEGAQTGVVQTENRRWTAADLHDRVLTIVFDAPAPGDARALIEAVRVQRGVKP